MPPTPTDDQVAALRRYATLHGRTWKTRLATVDWPRASYPGLDADDGARLQQLRNALGPSWLTKYKLPDPPPADPPAMWICRTSGGFYGVSNVDAPSALAQARKAGARRRKGHTYYTIRVPGATAAGVDGMGCAYWEPAIEVEPERVDEGAV